MSSRFVSVDDRHLKIHENDVEDDIRLERPNRLSSMFRQSDFVSVLLQSLLDDHSIDGFVLHAREKSANCQAKRGTRERHSKEMETNLDDEHSERTDLIWILRSDDHRLKVAVIGESGRFRW